MTLSDFDDIHTHDLNAGDRSVINLPWGADVPERGYYSVGIHPWDTSAVTDADLLRLESVAALDNVVAIGETGLDALRGAPLERQEAVFRAHVDVSERVGKPLIIHAVRTLSDIMRLRKELKPRQQWVIHGFRGKPELARQLVSHGIDISLGRRYNADVPRLIGPEHIYHETDAMPSAVGEQVVDDAL